MRTKSFLISPTISAMTRRLSIGTPCVSFPTVITFFARPFPALPTQYREKIVHHIVTDNSPEDGGLSSTYICEHTINHIVASNPWHPTGYQITVAGPARFSGAPACTRTTQPGQLGIQTRKFPTYHPYMVPKGADILNTFLAIHDIVSMHVSFGPVA